MRALLKQLVLDPLLLGLRTWREVSPAARPILLRLWLRGRAHTFPLTVPRSPRLLFVCHGNILRSTLAAAVANQLTAEGLFGPETEVESGGTGAMAGKPADPRGIVAARELGLDLGNHRAKPVTAEDVSRADLILVMDWINAAELLAQFPSAWPRTHLLGVFGDRAVGPMAIPDPYSGDLEAVRGAFRRVESAVRGLAARVNSQKSPR